MLITIKEAAKRGIKRIRKPIWADPMDHIELHLFGDGIAAWVDLYCPINMGCNGRDPVPLFAGDLDADDAEWEEYTGPLSSSPEYIEQSNKAAQYNWSQKL